MTDELLTLDELATYLKVSPTTARRMLREGEIPSTRIRRAYRVHRDDLEKYMRDHQVQAWSTARLTKEN